MSIIQIDRSVPMPDAKGGRAAKYPWHDMEVGDSFLAPVTEGGSLAKFQPAISNLANSVARRVGKKFATRREGNAVRVWRVA